MNNLNKQINVEAITNWLEDNIAYEEDHIERSSKSCHDLNYCWGTHNLEMYHALLKIVKAYSNGSVQQGSRKKCPGCGEMFTPKNQTQETCSGKCRVRLHRSKNKLKEFNAKVSEILKSKDEAAKFTVEQKLVEDGKCPFVVTYKGEVYEADNTKSLLTQLKKI
jgi:predicted nucleic acid-binding Zn ribbon protein